LACRAIFAPTKPCRSTNCQAGGKSGKGARAIKLACQDLTPISLTPISCVLLYQRDAAIALRQKEYPGKDIYEDRQLEITSFLPISVEGQMAAMDKVLA